MLPLKLRCALLYTRQNAPYLTETREEMLIFLVAYWVRDILAVDIFETQAHYWTLNCRTWEGIIPYGSCPTGSMDTKKTSPEKPLRNTRGLYSHPAFFIIHVWASFSPSLCAFSQMMFYWPSVIEIILQDITYCEAGERNIPTSFCHLSRS